MIQSKRLREVLDNKGENYILPFLWMHGEGKEILKEELERIYDCGIRAVCLESRPHPDFAGPLWWEEVDFIMEEANKRQMKVWILDDDKFPTGHANGAFVEKPELAKVYLAERHMDVCGPAADQAVLVEPFLGEEGELIAILACPKPDTESLAVSREGMLNLTGQMQDGMVYFDVPEGFYRIFVLFTTQKGGGRADYMNLIDRRSVKVLLDAVYEPHYQRYEKYVGSTFAGFFSDEPELGNTPGYDFQDHLGKRDVRLPWSQELEKELKSRWGTGFAEKLPALWYDSGRGTAAIRSDYMDGVTRLADTCFAGQIGEWCRRRGLSYIGHVIEDDNAHGRLGCSIGHYFRAQKGQDMSGIDVVLLQIIPGFTETYHQWIASDRDGEFFHYGLAKLGSSLAHLDKAKAGRALCEIYGAYGWGEGVSLMKWLTDHMLVRGINTFVPHAFSPLFPDRDCPPHFYARGENPQYRFFALLMKYMNRLSHLLNGGIHKADAAVLYHAESEWTGKEAMLFQKPVRQLLEQQLDCDVVSSDWLKDEQVVLEDGSFVINEVVYTSLIVPECTCIPQKAADFILKAAKRGIPIFTINSLPKTNEHEEHLPEVFYKAVKAIPLQETGKYVRATGNPAFSFSQSHKNLRASCYYQKDSRIYMFFNESPFDFIETEVEFLLEKNSSFHSYDGLTNTLVLENFSQGKGKIQLQPGQAAVYVAAEGYFPKNEQAEFTESDALPLVIDWKLSMSQAANYPNFTPISNLKAGESLRNMNGREGYPRFTGTFAYEGSFSLDIAICRKYMLQLPKVGDCAEIWMNETYAGMMIGAPYSLDVTNLVKEGENLLRIEVTNTLVWKMHDGQSTHMQHGPTGLLEPPVLHIYQ